MSHFVLIEIWSGDGDGRGFQGSTFWRIFRTSGNTLPEYLRFQKQMGVFMSNDAFIVLLSSLPNFRCFGKINKKFPLPEAIPRFPCAPTF